MIGHDLHFCNRDEASFLVVLAIRAELGLCISMVDYITTLPILYTLEFINIHISMIDCRFNTPQTYLTADFGMEPYSNTESPL